VTDADPPQKHYIVDVLIKVASDSVIEKKTTSSGLSPPPAGDAGRVVIIGVLLTTVQAISQLRIKLPQDLRSQEQKNTAYKAIGEIKKRMPDGPALLDPIKNMGINDKSFRDLIKVRPHSHAIADGSKSLYLRTRSRHCPSPARHPFLRYTISLIENKPPSTTSRHSSESSTLYTIFCILKN
jgi:superfamily II RNA helicase